MCGYFVSVGVCDDCDLTIMSLSLSSHGAGDKGQYLDVYLPQAVWYDWYTHDYVLDGQSPMVISRLPTPLDCLPVSLILPGSEWSMNQLARMYVRMVF